MAKRKYRPKPRLKSKPESKPEKHILISYFPLIDLKGYEPGRLSDAATVYEELKHRLGEVVPNSAKGVMWYRYPFDNPTSAIPVFLMERGDEIADHLVEWSEGEIARRFDLFIQSREEGFAMMLVPNLSESIRRWKLARLMFQDEVSQIPESDFTVLFSPLSVVCLGSTTFDRVKSEIADPTYFGFVDSESVDMENLADLDYDTVKIVGPVGVKKSDRRVLQFFDRLFAEAIEDRDR